MLKYDYFNGLILLNLTPTSQMKFVKYNMESRHNDCSWYAIIVAAQL
jgi:hypothetical protein